MEKWFQLFLKERKFLKNSMERTLKFYQASFDKFVKTLAYTPEKPTKAILQEFVIKMRETGISPVTCNIYIRGMNSYLSWLFEEEYISERLKIRQLKEEKKVLQTFSEQQLKALIMWKPKAFYEWRLYVMLCFLIDTGARINEVTNLETSKVDYENMVAVITGKGNKERIVPLSQELKKLLWKYTNKFEIKGLVFATHKGGKLSYFNMYRDFRAVAKKLGIEGVRISFHTLRHTFALSYVRNGGDLFHLQSALGHTTLTMTRRYCNLSEQDLKKMHNKTSILNRLK